MLFPDVERHQLWRLEVPRIPSQGAAQIGSELQTETQFA